MNPLLKMMLARLHRPAGEDGADTGGTDTATVEDRGDVVDPALTAENLQAVAGEEGDGTGEGDPEGGSAEGEAGAGEGEGDGAAAGEGDEQGAKPAPGIPKGRFNQVNQARKDAEAALALANKELERYRAQEAAAKPAPGPAPTPAATTAAATPAAAAPGAPFDVEAQEEAYVAALLDGDTKGAVAIRKAINAHLQREVSASATQELTQRQTAQLLESTAKTVSEAYPYLSTADGAEALDLILAARDRKVAKGMPIHLALLEAANAIAPKFAPEGEGTPSRDSGKAEPAKDLRPAAAVARGAADSIAQPPALQAGIGQRATAARVNVAQMTEEQFEALTPAEKKRLRGD